MVQSGNFAQQIANKINMPVDLIKTMLLMFASIPLAYLFHFLNKPTLRYAYSLCIGLIYLLYLLQQWAFYVYLVVFVPFLLFKIVGKNFYEISLATSICFLLFIHFYRFIYDYMGWKIDCSVSVMYMVTKVTYYGNYLTHHNLPHHKQHLSLFRYLSFCFYFPATLIGPSFNYTTFENFIEKKNGYKQPQIKGKLILLQVVQTVCFTIATIILMPIFHPYWALQNPQYLKLAPIFKFLALNFIGVCYRIKFYTAWGFAQLAVDLSGLSWNQKQNNYSSVRCGSPRFQTQLNPRNKTAYWNSGIQIWLKQIIYDKVFSKTKSAGFATFLTFLTSAIWHGVYLTYYVGFIQWAMIIIISKWAYKISQASPMLQKNIIVKVLAFIVASSLLNYTGMFIVVLTWDEALQIYKDMNFIGNILIFILLIASVVIKPKMFKPKHNKVQIKNAETETETAKGHKQ